MKNLLLFFFLFTSFSSYAFNFSKLYQQTIYVEQIDDKKFQESLEDFIAYLKKSTGKTFIVKKFSGQISNGIYLLWNKAEIVTNELNKKLSSGTIEDFIISGNSNRLLLIANHPSGFSLAIYTYLDMLGIKWYFPGEKWEYVPSKIDISYLTTNYFTPSFHLRNFFGTGSIRVIKDIDPNSIIMKEWEDWKRRNRLGGEFTLGGHYGEVFNYKHKVELQTHPEYLAMINGKRRWSVNNKWCISNKEFRKMFVADRVEELMLDLKNRKYPNEKIVLSADPADGSDDCECDNCKKLGTISERSYILANEVASAFAKISPLAYTNIYAYNTHAQIPSFNLAPNLIVQIVPYAFQTVGTPDQMINLWTKRHSNLLIYDYYCLPDWHYDYPMPYKTSPDTLIKRINGWKKNGFRGFTLETTYSIGLAGLGLYLMSQVSWNNNLDVVELKKKFLKNMFGPNDNKLGEYYEYVSNKYEGIPEVSYLFSILNETDDNANTIYYDRITDLKAYLHYLILFYQLYYNSLINHDSAWEEIMSYIWKIYPSKMIHSTRIAELLYANSPNADLSKKWSFYEPVSEKIKNIKSASSKEIEVITDEDAKKYPILENFPYAKGTLAVKYNLVSKIFKRDTAELLCLNWPETFIQSDIRGFQFYIKLRYESSPGKYFTSQVSVSCTDTFSKKRIYIQTQFIGSEWQKMSIQLPEKKVYKLSLEFKPWVLVKIPNDQWIGFSNIPLYSVMGKLWFYLPAGTKYFYYINNSDEQPIFSDSNELKVIPVRINDLNIYRLNTENKTGQWWSVSYSQYKKLQFFLKGNLFFTHHNYLISPN